MVTGGLPAPGSVTVAVVVVVVVVVAVVVAVVVTVVVDTDGVVVAAAVSEREPAEPAPHPPAPIAARPQAKAGPSHRAVKRAPRAIKGRVSHSGGVARLGVGGGLEPVVERLERGAAAERRSDQPVGEPHVLR